MENTSQSHLCPTIFVLGPPGSGKGTLCKAVANDPEVSAYCYCHLSVGDYLRQLCEPGLLHDTKNFDRDKIRLHMRECKLLPADVLIPVLEDKIASVPNDESATTIWLVDGFPRNMETALAFEKEIGKPLEVIILECGRDTAQGRFLSRGRERSDDRERFNKRYEEYVENIRAIREYYGNIVETVHVDGTRDECLYKFQSVLPGIGKTA